jgi:hypothetical protein
LTHLLNAQTFEISQNKNTYIYVKGIGKITVDIGTTDVISEINTIGEKSHVIKLKALKPFKKSSILLLSETEDMSELPVFAIEYKEESSILKYVLKYANGQIFLNDDKFNQSPPINSVVSEVPQDLNTKQNEVIELSQKAIMQSKKLLGIDVNEKAVELNKKIEDDREDVKINVPITSNNKKEIIYSEEAKADRLPYKFIDGKKSSNMRIELVKIAGIDKKSIYYYFNIDNSSGQDYEIEDVNFEITQKKKGNKKQTSSSVDSQKDKILLVKAKTEKEIIYKSNYFSLGTDETLVISIFEKTEYGRGRTLELNIDYDEFSKISTN